MKYIASIIVPIRVKDHFNDGTRRLRRLLGTVPDIFEVIVVDDGSTVHAAKFIKHLCSKYTNVKYHYLKTRLKRFSLSRTRNSGLKIASSEIVIFHDVDFLGTELMYRKIAEEITYRKLDQYPENFFCVPVAFLTQAGTQRYLNDFKHGDNTRYWEFSEHSGNPCDDTNFIVLGSSCIVANKEQLLSIGGHDERYTGHGAEDFELLHRLGKLYATEELPLEYSSNTGSGLIKEYRGFRAYFALFGKECRDKGITLVHLYHPKRAIIGYYNHRKNFKMLKNLMEKDCG